MVPALARRSAAGKAPVRMAFVYVPNGIDMRHWNPGYEGALGDAAADACSRSSRMKQDILLLGNLTHNTGRALLDGPGDHGRCCGSYLTGVQVKKTVSRHQGERLVRPAGGESDRQARRGFPSLEVGLEDARQAGDCDSGYSCAYTNNLAWRSETQPLPPILDPRALFERLFGDGAELTPEARARRRNEPAQHPRLRHAKTRARCRAASARPISASSTSTSPRSARSRSSSKRAERENAQVDPGHGEAVRRAAATSPSTSG